MMDELINTVSAKTGLSPEQAKSAAEAVIGFLKDKLPAPVGSALDSVTGGGEGGGMMGQAQGMLGNLGGMFGGGSQE